MSDTTDGKNGASRKTDLEARIVAGCAMARALRYAFDHAVVGVAMLKSDGEIEYCNNAWRRLLGFDTGEGAPLGQRASIMWNERAESTLAADSFPGGLDDDWQAEAMCRTDDGALIDVTVTVVPLAGPDGALDGLGAVLTNDAALADSMRGPTVNGMGGIQATTAAMHRSAVYTIRGHHKAVSGVDTLRRSGVR
jgi:PAS domain-containing protein